MKQRYSQTCVPVEAKRCTVGNLFDVEVRTGKCETRIAKLFKTGQHEFKRENGKEK